MSDNERTQEPGMNVDDVLGLNLNAEESGNIEPLKPARVYHPRILKDHHLTSIRGLPYIRKSAKKRIRKTVNHKDEYRNLTNFLSFYQIWGHNLFPKAKFPDFVDMCATAGMEKSVKILRRRFVNEDSGAALDQEFRENFVPTVSSIERMEPDANEQYFDDVARRQQERLAIDRMERDEAVDFEDQQFEMAARAREGMVREDAENRGVPSSSEETTSTTTRPVTNQETRATAIEASSQPQEVNSSAIFDADEDDFSDDDDDFFGDLGSKKTAVTQKATNQEPPAEEEFGFPEEDPYAAEEEYMRENGF